MKNINRRDFLKIMGASTGALALNGFIPRFFVSPAHAALSDVKVAQIFLDGGSDFLTTCLPEGDSTFMAKYRQIRPTLSLPLLDNTGATMARLPLVGTNYTLHPRLTELQTLYSRGQLAVVNKCGVPQFNSGSHEEAQQHIKYGMASGRATDPQAGWMKRVAESNAFPDSFKVFDRTGGGQATLGVGPFRPLAITNLSSYGFSASVTSESNFRLDTALALLGQQEHNAKARDYVDAYGIVENSVDRVRTAVQGTTFSPAFPTTSLGNQLKDAFIAFLNFDTRLAYTQIGGFDLHSDADPQGQNRNNPMGQSNRMNEINNAIAAFRANCERVGIWQNTVICINTEFGRTNAENGAKGLDHADAHVCFVLGGGVRGGIYGDAVTVTDISRPQNGVDATTSALDVYNEIVRYMGLNTSGLILPSYTPRTLGLFA